MTTVPVHEILHTIQGEGTRAGSPCVLVRTLGCDLSCAWCDTDQAGVEPVHMEIPRIVEAVLGTGCRLVEVTGGEPLLHAATPGLCEALLAAGLTVLVETSGSQDVSVLPPGTVRIMDLKPPSSGESGRMRWANVAALGPGDEIKIVIADKEDHAWATRVIRERLASFGGAILLSPLTPGLAPETLASWILRDGLAVRLNVQLHKLVFPAGESTRRIV